MQNYLWNIAMSGIKGKKRSSFFMILVLFLSITFAVVNISITGSFQKTQKKQREELYGEWNLSITGERNPAKEPVLQQVEIQAQGTAVVYGQLLSKDGVAVTNFGTIDEGLVQLGHLEIEEGRAPEKQGEIALEKDVLSALGYDYEIGQTLCLSIQKGQDKIIQGEYVLCGILKEYTDLWDKGETELIGAWVTEETADAIGEAAVWQTFLNVKGNKGKLYTQLQEDYELIQNQATAGARSKENYQYFNLVLIMLTTLIAVIVIYSMQIKAQMKSIHLFRIIGVTKRQLSKLLFYETLLLILPAAVLGVMAGAIITWGIIQILIQKSISVFYIAIPIKVIIGMICLWFAAVFFTRFLVFRYSFRKFTIKHNVLGKRAKRVGALLLSAAGSLVILFCFLQSLMDIYINDQWKKYSSYTLTTAIGDDYRINDEVLQRVEVLPGVEEIMAWNAFDGELEFAGSKENEFCNLLRENSRATQPYFRNIDGVEEPFPNGVGVRIYAIAEDNWDKVFAYSDTKPDYEKFKAGEEVLVYIPYNTESGVEWNQKTYKDFGLKTGDSISVTTYVKPDILEEGIALYTEEEVEQFEEEWYGEPVKEAQATASVGGVITADLNQEPYLALASQSYYAVFASENFMKNSNGYTHAFVYTGYEAEYASTDYQMAKLAEENQLQMYNDREKNAAYRQEALQDLMHLWVSGSCIFLILLLIQYNIEAMWGLAKRRTFALLQIVGMSKRQLRMRLAVKGIGWSMVSVLAGHLAYVVYFVIDKISIYQQFLSEGYEGTFVKLVISYWKGNIIGCGWKLPVHLGICICIMICAFMIYFYPQNKMLKGTIRENMN